MTWLLEAEQIIEREEKSQTEDKNWIVFVVAAGMCCYYFVEWSAALASSLTFSPGVYCTLEKWSSPPPSPSFFLLLLLLNILCDITRSLTKKVYGFWADAPATSHFSLVAGKKKRTTTTPQARNLASRKSCKKCCFWTTRKETTNILCYAHKDSLLNRVRFDFFSYFEFLQFHVYHKTRADDDITLKL